MVTGLICSLLLFKKANKKPANRFLGLGILAFVCLNTKILLLSFDLWGIHGIGFFPNGIELALPPLFYFYMRSLVEPTFKFTRRAWFHFAPFFMAQLYATIVYTATMQTSIYAEKQIIASGLFFTTVKSVEEYLTFISTLVYLYVVYKPIQEYQNKLSNQGLDAILLELRFLKNMMLAFLLLGMYTIINLLLSQVLVEPHQWRWQLSHLMIATLVYYMGLVGYKNSDLTLDSFRLKKPKKDPKLVDMEVIRKLKDAMEVNKVYLNPTLSLQELARMLELNETLLSNNINAHYQKNFRGFLNEVRVQAVKHRLMKEGVGNLSLLGIAKECGFNSEASFYRIFKASTGLTPKQFMDANPSITSIS